MPLESLRGLEGTQITDNQGSIEGQMTFVVIHHIIILVLIPAHQSQFFQT